MKIEREESKYRNICQMIVKFLLNVSIIILIVITIFNFRNFEILTDVKIAFSDKFYYNQELNFEEIYDEILPDFHYLTVY